VLVSKKKRLLKGGEKGKISLPQGGNKPLYQRVRRAKSAYQINNNNLLFEKAFFLKLCVILFKGKSSRKARGGPGKSLGKKGSHDHQERRGGYLRREAWSETPPGPLPHPLPQRPREKGGGTLLRGRESVQ